MDHRRGYGRWASPSAWPDDARRGPCWGIVWRATRRARRWRRVPPSRRLVAAHHLASSPRSTSFADSEGAGNGRLCVARATRRSSPRSASSQHLAVAPRRRLGSRRPRPSLPAAGPGCLRVFAVAPVTGRSLRRACPRSPTSYGLGRSSLRLRVG
jgi:hypothetical protein